MDIEQIKAYLETDEGKALVESSEVTNGLRLKKDELLSKNVQLTNQLKDYAALGDIETVKGLLAKVKTEDTPSNVQPDVKLNAQIEHLQKELDAERTLRTKREGAMVSAYANSQITSAIAKHKGVPELLSHLIAGRVQSEMDTEGKIVLTVNNEDGSPMFKNGKPASVEDLVQEFKANKTYGRAFDAEVAAQGSGARQQFGGRGVVTDPSDPNFNLTELMRKQSV